MLTRAVTLALLLVALFGTFSVHAQEPTETPLPAPTSTPVYLAEVPLSSGNTLLVERRISYGDAAIVIAVAILWITTILANSIKIPRLFIR